MKPPQAMQPSGLIGRPFGWIMERMNRRVYGEVLAVLNQPQSVLEIGFGTGGFLEMAAQAGTRHITGMDPSPLMLMRAQNRLAPLPDLTAKLFLGDDTALPSLDGPFKAITAIHSFQFWANPEASLIHIKRLLAPDGRLCLALRQHGRNPPNWLPNSISKSGRETEDVITLLETLGFEQVSLIRQNKHSDIISARGKTC